MDAATWRSLTDDEFLSMAGNTAMVRSGLERIRGNISDRR
jgi:hypothetical protein